MSSNNVIMFLLLFLFACDVYFCESYFTEKLFSALFTR